MVAPRAVIACMLVCTACESRGVPVCFEDEFESIDADRWQVMNPSSGAVTANGRLVIAVPPSTNTQDGLRGLARYDLTNGFVVFEIARFAEESVNAQSEVVVRIDDANALFVGATVTSGDGSIFIFRRIVGGQVDDVKAPFDPSVRFVRIAHDGDIEIATSTDGHSWVTRRTDPTPFAIDALALQIESDSFNGGVAVPGAFEVERVVFASPACDRTDREPAPHL